VSASFARAARRIIAGLAALGLASCGPGTVPPRSPDASAREAEWVYDVTLAPDSEALDVRATFAPGVLGDGTELSVTEGAEPFVREVAGASGPVTAHGGAWSVPSCANGCTLHYRFALADACASIGNDAVANGTRAAFEAPAGAWLLRPMRVRDGDTFRLTVRTPAPGTAFATGLRGTSDGPVTSIHGLASELSRAPYTLFGPLRSHVVSTGGANVILAMSASPRGASDDALVAWARRSGDAVAKNFGRFPIDGALVGILPGRRAHRSGVGFGRATASLLGGSILVDVGTSVDEPALRRDWVLVHEMIHLAVPSLDRKHRWMEEGLATYLEPLVRARAGLVEPSEVWTDFEAMMHKGLPEAGDRGLDVTRTWGRLYWGGALFCFVADVEIRKRSRGARSLDDALRAILDAGGNNGARWSIERTFAVGDAATGLDVLTSMYAAWKEAPVAVDLPRLFAELGVRAPQRPDEPVTFDDAAPLSAVRRAMTTARP
jgi:hypothetical protein